jgi:hypothetical protein
MTYAIIWSKTFDPGEDYMTRGCVLVGKCQLRPFGHTWQPTDLVNELWLRLLGSGELGFQNRAHFLGVAAHVMRFMVIDDARARCAVKRAPEGLPEMNSEFATLLALTDERSAELGTLNDALRGLQLIPRGKQKPWRCAISGASPSRKKPLRSGMTVKRQWERARARLHARMRGIEL